MERIGNRCNLLQQLNSVTAEKVEQNTFLKRQNKRIQLENEIFNPSQTAIAKAWCIDN